MQSNLKTSIHITDVVANNSIYNVLASFNLLTKDDVIAINDLVISLTGDLHTKNIFNICELYDVEHELRAKYNNSYLYETLLKLITFNVSINTNTITAIAIALHFNYLRESNNPSFDKICVVVKHIWNEDGSLKQQYPIDIVAVALSFILNLNEWWMRDDIVDNTNFDTNLVNIEFLKLSIYYSSLMVRLQYNVSYPIHVINAISNGITTRAVEYEHIDTGIYHGMDMSPFNNDAWSLMHFFEYSILNCAIQHFLFDDESELHEVCERLAVKCCIPVAITKDILTNVNPRDYDEDNYVSIITAICDKVENTYNIKLTRYDKHQ